MPCGRLTWVLVWKLVQQRPSGPVGSWWLAATSRVCHGLVHWTLPLHRVFSQFFCSATIGLLLLWSWCPPTLTVSNWLSPLFFYIHWYFQRAVLESVVPRCYCRCIISLSVSHLFSVCQTPISLFVLSFSIMIFKNSPSFCSTMFRKTCAGNKL